MIQPLQSDTQNIASLFLTRERKSARFLLSSARALAWHDASGRTFPVPVLAHNLLVSINQVCLQVVDNLGNGMVALPQLLDISLDTDDIVLDVNDVFVDVRNVCLDLADETSQCRHLLSHASNHGQLAVILGLGRVIDCRDLGRGLLKADGKVGGIFQELWDEGILSVSNM